MVRTELIGATGWSRAHIQPRPVSRPPARDEPPHQRRCGHVRDTSSDQVTKVNAVSVGQRQDDGTDLGFGSYDEHDHSGRRPDDEDRTSPTQEPAHRFSWVQVITSG
jgi:hypothetical protein